MSKPAISVVIGTYNQCDVLKLILESFNSQSLEKDKYEVIVVDSTSTDGTDQMMKAFKADFNFRYFIQDNTGKTGARNRGVDESSADIIFITDADMIAHKHLLREHVLAHGNTSKETCFEGLTYNLDRLEWPASDDILSPYIQSNLKDRSKLGWYYFLTGNISFPKALYFREGGLSKDFLGYGWEDLEFGYRLSKKNVPLYYLKNAMNYHYHVITKDEEIERNVKKGESARIFLKKHPELKWFLGLNPVSKFIFPKIKENGPFYTFMKKKCYNSSSSTLHKFGFWFLKEFHYLRGILSL
jgi:glycosyltransferase involved in cell wall biosynthesis